MFKLQARSIEKINLASDARKWKSEEYKKFLKCENANEKSNADQVLAASWVTQLMHLCNRQLTASCECLFALKPMRKKNLLFAKRLLWSVLMDYGDAKVIEHEINARPDHEQLFSTHAIQRLH